MVMISDCWGVLVGVNRWLFLAGGVIGLLINTVEFGTNLIHE